MKGMADDIHMETVKGGFEVNSDLLSRLREDSDIHMQTVKTVLPTKAAIKPWERELLESPEVKRKATVAQLCKSVSNSFVRLAMNTRDSLP